ncbi:MAG: ferrous iron transport protein B, partial [Deltaproteobacteria bacterium]|nr:ferrous iron transport protein B [Deltaproteobacteria bacterium]
MRITIALAGNPNAGKTTLFNELTGARQHVGNYPGVTVEKKEGTYIDSDRKLHIVDLPGTYSLTAYSLEEVVAREYLVNEKPAAVINIVDASNLERNLYLTVQFLELGVPLCIALNMMDVAKSRGIQIDDTKLSQLLGVDVIPMVARNGTGKKEIMAASDTVSCTLGTCPTFKISYGTDIDEVLTELTGLIEAHQFLTDTYPARWVALKYVETDEQIQKLGKAADPALSERFEKIIERLADHLQETLNTYPEALIADHRYGYIRSIIKQGVMTFQQSQDRLYMSDKIDKVVTNRFAGPIIMAAVVLALYHFVFTYSQAPVSWLEGLFGWIGALAETHLPDGLLKSLIVSGIVGGVGGVLGFVPLIMFMFFGIALLEDSGYLARVAFMMDRVFRIFGLHGSSVMAFIVSGGIAGGCAVPGIMATRTLKSPKERLATLLTVPFMNCGAK